MNLKYFVLASVILPLLLMPSVYAQESFISVQTDDQNYDEGDTIAVSGQVSSSIIEVGRVITLVLLTEGNVVDIAQITVAQDGTYSHTVRVTSLWETGDYIVRAAYGHNITESQFSVSEFNSGNILHVDYTVNEIPETFLLDDSLNLFGTGTPGDAITILLIDSSDKLILTRTAEIDAVGNWRLSEPIIFKTYTKVGIYNLVFSDGFKQIVKNFEVIEESTVGSSNEIPSNPLTLQEKYDKLFGEHIVLQEKYDDLKSIFDELKRLFSIIMNI
ncbi:hypothetical protein LCGC14_1511480 [marine sediment metagenome]|uniref:Uncharacterized protein n=1 Tax=marine sediment metagenome TaxID=412755 RepID=A0A0F9M2E8_9ZZZZ